jgi:uncharacterized membrane protein
MKDQSFKLNTRLIRAILMAMGLVAVLLLSFSLDAAAGILTPPQVLAKFPESNSHNAEVTTPISITYDQDIDPTTVNPQTFAVHARQTGWLMDALSVDGGMIMLQPTDPLHAGELVQVSATTSTLSMDGEGPVDPTVWEFTTAPWAGNAYFHAGQSWNDTDNRGIALGDLDGDGDLDLVTSNCGGQIYVFQNKGNANFAEIQQIILPHPTCISDVELGDLDSDGDLDVFVVSLNAVWPDMFLFNNGDGTFTLGAQTLPSTVDTYAKLGDLDGDGDLDIFVVSGGFDKGTIRVWKNDGTGNFTLGADFDASYEHTGVALGDLDNDGDLDAFTAGWNNTFNKIWLNDGTGAFSVAQVIPGANTYTPLLGDLDGDGYLDVYLANTSFDVTDLPDEVWLNDGTGHFTNSGQNLDTAFGLIPALGDLDADGDLDVYISEMAYAPDEVWLNDGAGNLSLGYRMDETYDGALVSLGDLDGDGDLDAVTGDAFTYYVVFINTGWFPANLTPNLTANAATVQCPDDPTGFYVIGGWGGDDTGTQTLRYDVNTGIWAPLADLPYETSNASAVCYQGKIYLTGGWINDNFLIYDITANIWTSGPNLPRLVGGAALGAWDGILYLMGGTEDDIGFTPVNQVDVYDIANGTWTADIQPNMPVATSFAGYAQAGPYLYIVGGFSGDFDFNVTATQRLNLATWEWEIGPTFTSTRAMFAAAITGQHLYAIGGDLTGGDFLDATDLVEQLDLTVWPDGSWQDFNDPLPNISQGNTSSCTTAVQGSEIWSTGGGYIDEYGDHVYDSNLHHPIDEPCADFYFGDLQPESLADSAFRGETVTYTLTIHNDGTISDTYDISANAIWNTTYPATVGPLEPGESVELLVSVEIPADSNVGESDIATITATSQGDSTGADEATLTTSVATEWVEATSLPTPLAANLVQCIGIPNSFYMVGGIVTGNVTSNTLYRFNIATQSWVQLAHMPAPLRAVAAACYHGMIYVAGGLGYDIYRTLYIYNILSNSWSVGPSLPDIVWGAAMGAWDGKLYVMGGTRIGDPYTPESRVDIYDIASEEWTAGGGESMPTAASFFGSVQTGPYIYAVGGYSGNFDHNVDQTQRYNMATNQWEIGPQFTSARALSPLAASSSHLYMLGGELDGGGPFETTVMVEQLDLSTWPSGNWTTLSDPLPEPNLFPATACSEALSGGEIWSVGGINLVFEPYNTNWYHPIGEPCVRYGVDLPGPWVGEGVAGETIEYTVTITNTGVVTDYFTLDVNTSWNIESPVGELGPIGPGESMQVAIAVEVPPDATRGDQDVTEITVASISNPSASDTTSITTTVLGYDFDVQSLPPDSQAGHPGDVLTYTLAISNIGDFEDSYTVTISATWDTVAPFTVGSLLPGDVEQLAVEVTIPQDVHEGEQDFATLTLTSHGDAMVSKQARLTSTTVGEYDFDLQSLPPDSQAGHPGDMLTYTLAISNIGDFEDNYTVTISATWHTVTPISVGPLQPGEETEMVATVEIPQDALHGDWDMAIITLTSQADLHVIHEVTLTSTAFLHRILIPLALRN